MTDFSAARRNMVDCQIRTDRVTNPALLAALSDIPRERFVDAPNKSLAYLDEDLPIGGGRYLTEPRVFARMVQELQVGPGDVVLDVGCGCGYASAVLARLASTVVALESDAELAGRATRVLAELGVDNVVVVEGPAREGYPSQAPYDVILINGAVPEIPDGLCDQLAEGGRLCAVVRAGDGPGCAVIACRRGTVISRRTVFDANAPALPGFERAAGFVF